MTFGKRIFDLCLLALTLPVTVPVFVAVVLLIFIKDGGPVIYKAARSGQKMQMFFVYKFRTMTVVSEDKNIGVSGGDKTARISGLGHFLRKTRLDELPQLINILIGDMTFVGPRPPDPVYTGAYPKIYHNVLKSRPGLTGLATLYMHRYEERILQACDSADQTDLVYRRQCIPRKAQLDMMYQSHQTICFDIWILLKSVGAVLGK